MPLGKEIVCFGKFVLQPFDLFVVHFGKRAALQTYEMVMVTLAVFLLIPCLLISDFDLFSETAFAHETEIAVYSGVAYFGILIFYDVEQLFHGYMFMRGEKGIDNNFPLPCRTQPFLSDTIEKKILSFPSRQIDS
jgi:hypothetical protein